MSLLSFRKADETDLPQVMELLADDVVSPLAPREAFQDQARFLKVFREIHADPNNEILVGVFEGRVVACIQSTYIPCLTLAGLKRVLIEGVRVEKTLRSQGIGDKFFAFALERARDRGCQIAQLTTNKTRRDAVRFYERLGFAATHEGLKKALG